MANTYRMRATAPSVVVIEMNTVSGWISVDTVQSVFHGVERIKELKAKDDWICQIYDEQGNVAGSAGATNQSMDHA